MVEAHPGLLRVEIEPTFVARAERATKKVALLSGGGSGTSRCMRASSAAACSTPPAPARCSPRRRPTRCWPRRRHRIGRGVLFIVKNYAGDSMNFQIASEMLDIENATVLVDDDVAVEKSRHTTGRRGVAGTLMVEKMVGAAAEAGAALLECKAVGDRVNASTASMGVAFTSCTVPAAGRATFDIDADAMEIGVGIHGEPGRRREKIKPAGLIVDDLLGAILADLKPERGREVLLHRERLRRHTADGAVPGVPLRG
jgi:dihydroxyacetone kinase-like protein